MTGLTKRCFSRLLFSSSSSNPRFSLTESTSLYFALKAGVTIHKVNCRNQKQIKLFDFIQVHYFIISPHKEIKKTMKKVAFGFVKALTRRHLRKQSIGVGSNSHQIRAFDRSTTLLLRQTWIN